MKRLVIRRRCSNAISHEAQEGCMHECFVYWCERVLRSLIATGTQRVVPTAKAHSCTTLRSVVRQVTVDTQRRFLIRFESHLLLVWTFRCDDDVRYSPHNSGQPFHWRVETMRTMVLEPACVDSIETLSQARLVTITTFSFFSTNAKAVISLSDGLHVSFRVVLFFCTRKRSCLGRTIPDACPFEKDQSEVNRNSRAHFVRKSVTWTCTSTWSKHDAIIKTQLTTQNRGAVVA